MKKYKYIKYKNVQYSVYSEHSKFSHKISMKLCTYKSINKRKRKHKKTLLLSISKVSLLRNIPDLKFQFESITYISLLYYQIVTTNLYKYIKFIKYINKHKLWRTGAVLAKESGTMDFFYPQ